MRSHNQNFCVTDKLIMTIRYRNGRLNLNVLIGITRKSKYTA